MIFSGVAGISRRSKPACRSALITAGAGPSIGISPTPFAPNGPCVYGFSSITTSSFGVSSVVGNDVVGELAVRHAAVAHDDLFEQRVAESLRAPALDLAGAPAAGEWPCRSHGRS